MKKSSLILDVSFCSASIFIIVFLCILFFPHHRMLSILKTRGKQEKKF